MDEVVHWQTLAEARAEMIIDLEELVYTQWCDVLVPSTRQLALLHQVIQSVNPHGDPSVTLGFGHYVGDGGAESG